MDEHRANEGVGMTARNPDDIDALRAASDLLGIDALLSDEERGRRTAHPLITQVSVPQLPPAEVLGGRFDLDDLDVSVPRRRDAPGKRIR